MLDITTELEALVEPDGLETTMVSLFEEVAGVICKEEIVLLDLVETFSLMLVEVDFLGEQTDLSNRFFLRNLLLVLVKLLMLLTLLEVCFLFRSVLFQS